MILEPQTTVPQYQELPLRRWNPAEWTVQTSIFQVQILSEGLTASLPATIISKNNPIRTPIQLFKLTILQREFYTHRDYFGRHDYSLQSRQHVLQVNLARSPRTRNSRPIPHGDVFASPIRKIHSQQFSPHRRWHRLSLQATHRCLRRRGSEQHDAPWINANRFLHRKRCSRRRILPILGLLRRKPNQEQRLQGHPLDRRWLPNEEHPRKQR